MLENKSLCKNKFSSIDLYYTITVIATLVMHHYYMPNKIMYITIITVQTTINKTLLI